jgi:hypothetical protein
MTPATINGRCETRCDISGDSQGSGGNGDGQGACLCSPQRWQTQMNIRSITVRVSVPLWRNGFDLCQLKLFNPLGFPEKMASFRKKTATDLRSPQFVAGRRPSTTQLTAARRPFRGHHGRRFSHSTSKLPAHHPTSNMIGNPARKVA